LEFEVNGQSYVTGALVRHNGGFLADINGDGWEDIHLPFLMGVILSVDSNSGNQIAVSQFDAASSTEPESAKWFHSGRNYGGFTSYVARNSGSSHLLISAGNQVGTFQDFNCNVARFIAKLDQSSSGFSLVHSEFIGFSKNSYSHLGSSLEASTVSRRGDDINHCVHRASDSVVYAGDEEVTIYNLWESGALNNRCDQEQYDESVANHATEQADAWSDCAQTNFLGAGGSWSLRAIRLSNMGGANSWQGAYMWGKLVNFHPSYPAHILVQFNPNPVIFNWTHLNPEASFYVVGIKPDYHWDNIGTIPITPVDTPKLQYVVTPTSFDGSGASPIEGNVGSTHGGISALVLEDVDNDGLMDVEFSRHGTSVWYGYNSQTDKFETKTKTSTPLPGFPCSARALSEPLPSLVLPSPVTTPTPVGFSIVLPIVLGIVIVILVAVIIIVIHRKTASPLMENA